MKDKPLVSVFIPVYNAEKYIVEAVESVVNQNYENIELVISDDASKDNTPRILEKLFEKYPSKIKLFLQEKNLGITKNCNFIFQHCKGKYIAFYAGDDKMLPNKISKQVEVLENNLDVAICGTTTSIINDNSKEIDVVKAIYKKTSNIYSIKDLIKSGNSLVPTCSYMTRSEYIPKHGYDYRLPVASDSLFWYHIAARGDIYIIDEKLSAYRKHSEQSTSRRYDDDSLVSLALCEYYFPQCVKEIYESRAILTYQIARRKMKQNEFSLATYYLKMSLKNKFRVRTCVIYLLNKIKEKSYD